MSKENSVLLQCIEGFRIFRGKQFAYRSGNVELKVAQYLWFVKVKPQKVSRVLSLGFNFWMVEWENTEVVRLSGYNMEGNVNIFILY